MSINIPSVVVIPPVVMVSVVTVKFSSSVPVVGESVETSMGVEVSVLVAVVRASVAVAGVVGADVAAVVGSAVVSVFVVGGIVVSSGSDKELVIPTML